MLAVGSINLSPQLMDLTKVSRADLAKLSKNIDRELKKRDRKAKAEARKKIQAIAQEAGFPIAELVEEIKKPTRRRKSSGKRAKAAVKYRDPNNAKNTWAGRGRMPKWMAAEIEKGKSKEDFSV